MSDRALAYRDPVLRFDALHLVALHEGGRIEEILATENEREILMHAPAHVHSGRPLSQVVNISHIDFKNDLTGRFRM